MKETLHQLVAAFPDTKLKEDTLKVYAEKLADLPVDVLERAVHVCIVTQKWFPKISEIREAAADIIMHERGVPDADTAWGEVKQAVRNGGDMANKLAWKAIGDFDGMHEFAQSATAYEYKYREQFIARYNALLAEERRKVIVGNG